MTLPRSLGDGLVLRHGTPADGEALAKFNADMHGPIGEGPDYAIYQWTLDLMRETHPTVRAADFMVVEDQATGQIVSTLNLISQRWSYGGIELPVGRPELIATHPDYRRRGLVRAQMEAVHAWSAARGELAQFITGIPWYYRQFGYEMGLEFGGGRSGPLTSVPPLPEGEEEPYRVRPATHSDCEFMAALYEAAMGRYLVRTQRDSTLWQYDIEGRSRESVAQVDLFVIEGVDGEPVGFLGHPTRLWHKGLALLLYELKPTASWLAVTPSVLRYLQRAGHALATEAEPLETVSFMLGTSHPAYALVTQRMPRTVRPYALYVRVPDMAAFLRHVAPLLEERLASIAAGHTGELKLNFYRSGVRLRFEAGRLTEVEAWKPPATHEGDAAFPELSFLHLLFGHRSLATLRDFYIDCWVDGAEKEALLAALFPPLPSSVWPVG